MPVVPTTNWTANSAFTATWTLAATAVTLAATTVTLLGIVPGTHYFDTAKATNWTEV